MKIVSSLSAPFVWLLSVPTAFILKVLGVHASVEPPVTDEEIKDLIEAGTKAGVFEETEQDMIESVIELEDQRVTSLMTPRTNIDWIDIDAPVEKIKQQLAETNFSRLPVGRGTLDNILGYVTAKAILRRLLRGEEFDLAAVLQKPLYLPESITILELLEQFRLSHTHVAMVIDEFGGVEGLVTTHDVTEAIVGELATNPHEFAEEKVQRSNDGTLVVDGRLTVFEFKEALEIEQLPGEDRGGYETVAGFVLSMLGRLPKPGDRFHWGSYEFHIQTMERNRIGKILISPASSDAEQEQGPAH